MKYELYSLKEKQVYTEENAMYGTINGVNILCTPKGEPLVVRLR
jgi:hypothetical protein